jgi:hypothetical protein
MSDQCSALHRLVQARMATGMRQAFSDLAEMWERVAAETEADGILSRALVGITLNEPYEALPRALNLRSEAA